jgi:hypothetical protein
MGAAEFRICEWRLRTEERKIRAIGVICGFLTKGWRRKVALVFRLGCFTM